MPPRTRQRIRLARWIAVAADVLQIGLMPVFVAGGFSWVNDALDVAVAATMVILLGWHVAFLPTLVAELIPFVDLFPTWTVAVFAVTRGGAPPAPGVGPSKPA
ncbi:MAG: hypothetical protein A2W00_13935 [Candidatus Eisenbacteria bacterium RBG_16_71_46]|nr:MAG: hypothetical protein A2W00_13935 [Candidatus Eisenbacteria bacterium RBG_16_71_46]